MVCGHVYIICIHVCYVWYCIYCIAVYIVEDLLDGSNGVGVVPAQRSTEEDEWSNDEDEERTSTTGSTDHYESLVSW